MKASDPPHLSMRIRLKYPDVDTFIEKYASNINKSGMFIQSRVPPSVDTILRFQLVLQDGTPLLRGRGRVVWVKEYDAAHPDQAHGMGVRFLQLDETSRAVIERVLAFRDSKSAELPDSGSSSKKGRRPALKLVPALPPVQADALGAAPSEGPSPPLEPELDAQVPEPAEDKPETMPHVGEAAGAPSTLTVAEAPHPDSLSVQDAQPSERPSNQLPVMGTEPPEPELPVTDEKPQDPSPSSLPVTDEEPQDLPPSSLPVTDEPKPMFHASEPPVLDEDPQEPGQGEPTTRGDAHQVQAPVGPVGPDAIAEANDRARPAGAVSLEPARSPGLANPIDQGQPIDLPLESRIPAPEDPASPTEAPEPERTVRTLFSTEPWTGPDRAASSPSPPEAPHETIPRTLVSQGPGLQAALDNASVQLIEIIHTTGISEAQIAQSLHRLWQRPVDPAELDRLDPWLAEPLHLKLPPVTLVDALLALERLPPAPFPQGPEPSSQGPEPVPIGAPTAPEPGPSDAAPSSDAALAAEIASPEPAPEETASPPDDAPATLGPTLEPTPLDQAPTSDPAASNLALVPTEEIPLDPAPSAGTAAPAPLRDTPTLKLSVEEAAARAEVSAEEPTLQRPRPAAPSKPRPAEGLRALAPPAARPQPSSMQPPSAPTQPEPPPSGRGIFLSLLQEAAEPPPSPPIVKRGARDRPISPAQAPLTSAHSAAEDHRPPASEDADSDEAATRVMSASIFDRSEEPAPGEDLFPSEFDGPLSVDGASASDSGPEALQAATASPRPVDGAPESGDGLEDDTLADSGPPEEELLLDEEALEEAIIEELMPTPSPSPVPARPRRSPTGTHAPPPIPEEVRKATAAEPPAPAPPPTVTPSSRKERGSLLSRIFGKKSSSDKTDKKD